MHARVGGTKFFLSTLTQFHYPYAVGKLLISCDKIRTFSRIGRKTTKSLLSNAPICTKTSRSTSVMWRVQSERQVFFTTARGPYTVEKLLIS